MKRIFSLVIVACLLLNVIYLSAYAREEEPITEFCGWEFFDLSQVQDSDFYYAPSYYYNFTNGKQTYDSYALLSPMEKSFYDSVINLPIGTLSFTVTYSPNLTKEEYESIDFTKIMHAICLDHPEIFYYNGYGISRSYYPSTGAVSKIIYNIGVKKHGQTNADIYSTSNIPAYSKALDTAFKNVSVDTSNRYNFVKSVHDYLCNNVTYINDYASCHDVYGTLVNKVAVCQGYAETMKLFCDYYKIPCVCLTGTANGGAHMWNAIQMDDGRWYLLDVTWDDQTDSYGIFYDFFLIGLNTKDTYFSGSAFDVSHVSDGNLYLPNLDYASEKYTETNHNTAFKATYNSLAKDEEKYLIRSYFDTADTNVYYNGMFIETNNLTTNDVFKVPSGTGGIEEYWTLVVLGDCNGDGEFNALDYSEAVNMSLLRTPISDAYHMAADIDCDGYIDGIDVSMIYLLENDLADNIVVE